MHGDDSKGSLGSQALLLRVERRNEGVKGAGGARPHFDLRLVEEDTGDGGEDEAPAGTEHQLGPFDRLDHPGGP